MNGITLKSNNLPPLKVERIKWISLLILSHIISYLIFSLNSSHIPKHEVPQREGFLRLTIHLNNHIPLEETKKDVLIMTSNKRIISRQVRILKVVGSSNTLGTIAEKYLIEIPEEDLPKLIQNKSQKIFAYPSTLKIKDLTTKRRSKDYEVHF